MSGPRAQDFTPVFQRGWGLILGRFRADPYENYMAASVHLGAPFCVLRRRALFFGVYIRVPEYLESPKMAPQKQLIGSSPRGPTQIVPR